MRRGCPGRAGRSPLLESHALGTVSRITYYTVLIEGGDAGGRKGGFLVSRAHMELPLQAADSVALFLLDPSGVPPPLIIMTWRSTGAPYVDRGCSAGDLGGDGKLKIPGP